MYFNTNKHSQQESMASDNDESRSMVGLDQRIQPSLTVDTAKELAEKLYKFEIKTVKELDSYGDQNFYLAVKESDFAKLQEYNMKVINSIASLDTNEQDAQTQIMLFLNERGIQCPKPVRLPNGEYMILEKLTGKQASTFDHMVRLLTSIPGTKYRHVEMTPDLCYQAGRHIASIDTALKDFYHEGLERPNSIYSLLQVPVLEKYTHVYEEKEKRDTILSVITAFKDNVITNYPKLTKGTIHGDYSDFNIIVTQKVNSNIINSSSESSINTSKYEICGVLDFGEASHCYYVFEVGIALAYTMLISKEPMVSSRHMLAGYLYVLPLTDLEKNLLYYCIAARIAQSVTIGMYTFKRHPYNMYLLTTQEDGWRTLNLQWKTPKEEVQKQWDEIITAYSAK
ncbi:hydroxylysine kinase-like [Glandiceps talaboti]